MVPALLMERGRNSVWNREIWRYDWKNEQSRSMFRKILCYLILGVELQKVRKERFLPRKNKLTELFGTEQGLEQAWVRQKIDHSICLGFGARTGGVMF